MSEDQTGQIILDLMGNIQKTVQNRTNFEKVPANKTEEVEAKIEQAKKIGLEQIEQFKQLTREYANNVRSLCVVERELPDSLEASLVDIYADEMLIPLIKGEKGLAFLNDEQYKEARRHIFYTLIKNLNG